MDQGKGFATRWNEDSVCVVLTRACVGRGELSRTRSGRDLGEGGESGVDDVDLFFRLLVVLYSHPVKVKTRAGVDLGSLLPSRDGRRNSGSLPLQDLSGGRRRSRYVSRNHPSPRPPVLLQGREVPCGFLSVSGPFPRTTDYRVGGGWGGIPGGSPEHYRRSSS